jgi:hypothetical protein
MRNLSFFLLMFIFAINFSIAQTSAGNALSLDGTDDYAAPITPNISGITDGTVEFWFLPTEWNTSTAMWSGGNGHPGVTGDWSRLGSHSPTVGNSNLVFGVYSGSWRWSNSGVQPDSGVWRHVAATWNSSGLKLYLDGELYGSNTYSSGMQNYYTELVGASAWGGFFNGLIDEMRIWNVARDSVQINSTLLDTLSSDYYSTSDSGLVAYYRMEMLEDLGINGDGTDDLRDLSVNGNHLDTYGDPILDISGAFIITGVEKIDNHITSQFHLSQNYPNPFNPSTNIQFRIAETGFTRLTVYDVIGNKIETLISENLSAGEYEIEFNASQLSSGIYFYKLQSGSFIETKKMLLLR